MSTAYRSIYVTTADRTEATRIARTLIDEQLVACANFFAIDSIFRWNGAVESGAETALIMKTRADLVDAVIARTAELHTYDVPCIVAWPIEAGHAPYLNWITASTKKL